MAYSPLYNTHVEIDTFRGLNQAGDGHNLSMRYATEMENVNVDTILEYKKKGVRVNFLDEY